MPNFINAFSKMMPLWKGSYDGWVLEEASPGFLLGAFAGDFKEFILDHLLITSRLSLGPSWEIWPVLCRSPTHVLLFSFTENTGLSDLCLFGHLFNGTGWALDGFQTVCFYLENDPNDSHIFLSSLFSLLSCLFLTTFFSLCLWFDSLCSTILPSVFFSPLLS